MLQGPVAQEAHAETLDERPLRLIKDKALLCDLDEKTDGSCYKAMKGEVPGLSGDTECERACVVLPPSANEGPGELFLRDQMLFFIGN
jgi:hypothetical protein